MEAKYKPITIKKQNEDSNSRRSNIKRKIRRQNTHFVKYLQMLLNLNTLTQNALLTMLNNHQVTQWFEETSNPFYCENKNKKVIRRKFLQPKMFYF